MALGLEGGVVGDFGEVIQGEDNFFLLPAFYSQPH
jgi:hypothetical protein